MKSNEDPYVDVLSRNHLSMLVEWILGRSSVVYVWLLPSSTAEITYAIHTSDGAYLYKRVDLYKRDGAFLHLVPSSKCTVWS